MVVRRLSLKHVAIQRNAAVTDGRNSTLQQDLSRGRRPSGGVMLALWLVFAALQPVVGQDAAPATLNAAGVDRIAVVPFVNTTDVEQWDNLAAAMTDTIRLTLQLGGRYDVGTPDMSGINPYAPDGPLQLRSLSERRRLDAAVIGRISSMENGRIELETSVWSAATGQILGSERRQAFGAFDIIDAADELVILASSALMGYQVDFGAAVLRPSRDDVDYAVAIDGIPIGSRVRSIPQILTGARRFDVTVTVAGREQLVYSAERQIRPGEAIELSFGLPRVTRREQQEIRVRHELARNLLGQPDQFRVAFEALSESRNLLAQARESEVVNAMRQEQELLETAWQLDEEFVRMTPAEVFGTGDGSGSPSAPEDLLPGTYRIAADRAGDPLVDERVRRNGLAQYHLLRLRWVQALGEARWDDAELTLSAMDAVVSQLDLADVRGALATDRRRFDAARQEAEVVQQRRRRPWPYLGLAVGLGGAGYGGYLLATDAVGSLTDDADATYAEYQAATTGADAERLRSEAEDLYDEAELTEWIQWGSIAVGGVVTLVSSALLVRNSRAGEAYLRDWAREQYGRDIDVAERIAERMAVAPPDDRATIVVLGPGSVIADLDGAPRSLPVLVDQEPGLPVGVGRPPVVAADRTRLYASGISLAVVD